MSASLLFDGTIEICDPGGHVSGASYWFETLADGASFGDPQPVEVVVASLIRYGAIVTTTGDENREPSFLIRVCGSDSQSLHEGVQALHMATRKRTTLVWTAPDGYLEPLAWDVETSHLLEADGFDDLALTLRNQQVFRLQLKALPYRRSLTAVVDDAGTPPSSGGDLLYNCESTTNWSAFDGTSGTYSVDAVLFAEGAGSLKSEADPANVVDIPLVFSGSIKLATIRDQFTSLTIDTDTGGYLKVAIRLEWSENVPVLGRYTGVEAIYMQVDGAWEAVPSLTAVRYDDNGFVHYTWPVDASLTVTGLRFHTNQYKSIPAPGELPHVWYDDIELLPSATTDHQIIKQLTVQGSAPTPASLRVAAASESTALGHVLIATVPTDEIPSGFQPDGARWVTQGDTTVDASAIAGVYYTPDTDYSAATGTPDRPIFNIPVGMLTAKSYTMVGLVKAESSTATFGVQAQLNVDGTLVGPTSEAEYTADGLTTGWQFITAGTVELPPLPMQNADETTTVRLIFKGAKLADVYFIPAWEVNGWPVADFSIMDCGSGTVEPGGASSSAWLDSPSIANDGLGDYSRGPTPDRANAQSAWPDLKVPGIHFFKPGGVTAFLVSTGAAGPTLTLEYFPRVL